MLYTLKNDRLTVQVNSYGAELFSVKDGDLEYIWQGDEKYWKDRSPMLFPICGRLWDGKFTYGGKTYEMGCHGFARKSEFKAEQVSDTELHLVICSDGETKKSYPFDFTLTVVYRLEGDTLSVSFVIRNDGDTVLPASVGGHPGFNVPLDGKGSFEDYYLEFGEECSPDEMLLNGAYFSGQKRGYALEDGKIFRLKHSLFDLEGVFLTRVADSITLKSDKSERSVTVRYPDMPYVGIWQEAKVDAPFICVEPWSGFAGYYGADEEIETRSDMFRIQPGKTKVATYSMTFR